MLDADLRSAIGTAVESALSPFKVLGTDLIEGQDYDGNDVIFVTVHLPSETGPLPASNYIQAMSAVSQRLLQSNDERMPLLKTMREGEPESAEDEPAEVS